MMSVLWKYEQMSVRLINRNKSFFYLCEKTPVAISNKLRKWTGISQGKFPFIYLGGPIFYRRKKITYFDHIVIKVGRKILGWQNKSLSFGGRYTLISYVLQFMLVHLLPVMNPPKGVINRLH